MSTDDNVITVNGLTVDVVRKDIKTCTSGFTSRRSCARGGTPERF